MARSYNTAASITDGRCATECRSGPWPRKRWFRSKRFLASTAFGSAAPSYNSVAGPYGIRDEWWVTIIQAPARFASTNVNRSGMTTSPAPAGSIAV
jgi:hypothetical protein